MKNLKKIKLIINYPKWTNFYIFLSDLSQWNQFINFPNRRRIWLKQIPPLSLEEKNALRQFKEILQNSKGNPEIALLFAPPSQLWQIIKKIIGQEKTKQLKLVFRIFKPKFDPVFKKRYKDFRKLKKAIQNQQSAIKQALPIIHSLCNISQFKLPSPLTIKLLFSQGKNDIQAWAYKKTIAIEGLSYPLNKINDLINEVLLHEYFHLALNRNRKIKSKIISLTKTHKQTLLKLNISEWPPHVILEEALISTFLPEGYLGEKLSHKNIKKEALKQIKRKKIERLLKIRYFCALKMYDLANKYVDNQKPIDTKYLIALLKTLKQANKIQ